MVAPVLAPQLSVGDAETPVAPLIGAILANAPGGGTTYVKPFVSVPTCVSGLVTTTFTVPAARAPVVAVIDVALLNVTPVAATPPMATVAPFTNPVPAMPTEVPPVVGPLFGVMLVTVGAAIDAHV